jgi:hypothetical protein
MGKFFVALDFLINLGGPFLVYLVDLVRQPTEESGRTSGRSQRQQHHGRMKAKRCNSITAGHAEHTT